MQISKLPPPISITAVSVFVLLNSASNDASTSPEIIFIFRLCFSSKVNISLELLVSRSAEVAI